MALVRRNLCVTTLLDLPSPLSADDAIAWKGKHEGIPHACSVRRACAVLCVGGTSRRFAFECSFRPVCGGCSAAGRKPRARSRSVTHNFLKSIIVYVLGHSQASGAAQGFHGSTHRSADSEGCPTGDTCCFIPGTSARGLQALLALTRRSFARE